MVDRWAQTALRLDPVDRVASLEYGQQASKVRWFPGVNDVDIER